MALEKITGGFFDSTTHGYYSPSGSWVPSITQVLALAGYSDYDHIDPSVLERKRLLGTEAHDHCATIDKYGDVDPSWISEECRCYVDAYRLFRHQRNFIPDVNWVEKPIIASIYGMLIGMTLDVAGKLDGFDAILERKCVEAPQACWAVQTCLQEMGRFNSNTVGRAQRFALQMKKDGTYRINPHQNHHLDQSRAVGALVTCYGRLDCGQKLWEKV